jgi:hypothetical protein
MHCLNHKNSLFVIFFFFLGFFLNLIQDIHNLKSLIIGHNLLCVINSFIKPKLALQKDYFYGSSNASFSDQHHVVHTNHLVHHEVHTVHGHGHGHGKGDNSMRNSFVICDHHIFN